MTKRLLILNGIAIICVILFHAAGTGLMAMSAWRGQYMHLDASADSAGSPAYYVLRLIEQFIVFCLPAFLFVSGFFAVSIMPRSPKPVGWEAVGARARKLFLPYAVWSCALFFLLAAQGKTYSLARYTVLLLTGSTDPSYYYVIVLCQLYLIAPLLVAFGRWNSRLLLITAGIIQGTVQLLFYPVFLGWHDPVLQPFVDVIPNWLFVGKVFWFSFGVVASLHLSEFKQWIGRHKRALISIAPICYVVGVVEWEFYFKASGQAWLGHRETLIDDVYAAAVLMAFLAFDRLRIPFSHAVSELGTKSFGIYIAHTPVMTLMARLLYHFAPLILAHQILLQPLLITVGLAAPLLFMAAVRRSPAQRLYPVLFG
jgi:peptidoglycan/LPS O-acetylase OafA/YrhL